MTRIMFDSDDIGNVPRSGASMIAFYADQFTYPFRTVAGEFPGWSLIPIDRTGGYVKTARVFDVETGAISPASNLAEIIAEYNETSPYYKGGGRPIVYCDRDNIAEVRIRTGKYILARDYYLWIATLDGTIATAETLGLPENSVVACQDLKMDGYDSSVVFSSQWVPNAG
jgi:hypothetical protein